MNLCVLMGRATRDAEVRYSTNDTSMAIAKYSLAVDREGKDKGTDFINITAFGKNGEFAEKYVKKGTKLIITGHIATGSYTNKDGQKVNTFDVIADKQRFCESKKADNEGFTEINFPVDVEEEELPF